MLQFLTSIIIASLLVPAGFNALVARPVSYSYASITDRPPAGPQRIAGDSIGIQTTAKTVLVVDDASGIKLYAKNSADIVAPIASITKLMTALVFLDHNPGWDTLVTISKDDQRVGGIINLINGDIVSTRDLFNIMLVASSNEAAIALARSTGRQDFVAAMNRKAAGLGLKQSQFVDPAGLSAGNMASAGDLVKLANAAFDQAEITSALTIPSYQFTVRNTKRRGQVASTDQLLGSFLNSGPYRILGAKTGHLNEAGYCLLLRVQPAGGPSITLVLLGADSQPDRWQEAKGLVDFVFTNYRWPNF